jgi:short-subunit dehydrogenase
MTSQKRPLCLITGPSSGIGLELATLFARGGHDLVLVARSRDRLEDVGRGLSEEYGIASVVLASDLADPASPRAIGTELAARGLEVDVLVNNAGFGVYGLFAETPLEKELEMIQVNVAALTHLTKLFLPGMIGRRRGKILNVASTAGFQPGPLMAVYYATKAYVLSFSEALANETRGTGVTVTALCPGPTITEFQKTAGLEDTRLFNNPFVLSAADAARAGYEGLRAGKSVVVPGIANALLVQAERLSPRRITTAISRKLQESKK